MNHRVRITASLLAGAAVLALLVRLTIASPPSGDKVVPAILLGMLVVFTTVFGVPLAGGRGSLLPMTTAAAFLILGPVPTAWIVFLGALVHGWIRYFWAEKLEERRSPTALAPMALAMLNASIQTISILVAGCVYGQIGGSVPLSEIGSADLLPLVLLGFVYLGVNLLIAGIYLAALGLDRLRQYFRSLPNVILYEGWPMIFAPLMALSYTRLGLGTYLLAALAIVVASLVARNLSLARMRLERRVKELSSLQAVGQALSASLDLDSILKAIQIQVSELMPADNLYVALYDSEIDEVSFPLATEFGERVHWRSRRTGNGLTEYVLRTQAPLLIPEEYESTIASLGIEKIGRPAASWLGVPILAGDEPLGVIAVQSFSTATDYDLPHQDVLVTIAAQAAVAIQNARLYARTDEALALRVQELNSILRTTREGILLIDRSFRIVTANRALADLVGIAQLELTGQNLRSITDEEGISLLKQLGFTPEDLDGNCQALIHQEDEFERIEITIHGLPERHVERTLAPVHDREGETTGWLLVFRDVTEERKSAQMRDDLTNMLIHDLRSPLTVVISSLEIIRADLTNGDMGSLEDLVQLAESSSRRLLRLVNDLLDISRLESGNMDLEPESVDATSLLEAISARFAAMADQAQIEMAIEAEGDLPPVCADLVVIDRVMHNLVDNAVKFTSDGGHVRLWARRDPDDDAAFVLIGVSDDGPGMSPEIQARLFEKFQQTVSRSGRRLGTGLGLPFCKLAVEAHGGKIWAESQVGRGSTFVVRLPVADLVT